VWRDSNKDHTYDYDNSTIDVGMFGINIHHAGAHSENVNNWSAGCTVFANMDEFDDFMGLVDLDVQNNWGQIFTYTLLNEDYLS
jgi:hypothetical protein